jgi:hypothetical protein
LCLTPARSSPATGRRVICSARTSANVFVPQRDAALSARPAGTCLGVSHATAARS